MTGFFRWLRSIMAAVLNGIANFAFPLLLLIFLVLLVVGLARGDGGSTATVRDAGSAPAGGGFGDLRPLAIGSAADGDRSGFRAGQRPHAMHASRA